jgi:hypothetical protein
MAKQVTIPGTERPDHPELEKICLEYVGFRDERAELSKKEAKKKVEMFAFLRANNVESYRFWDPNSKVYRVARIKEADPTVEVIDTGEGMEEVGSGVAFGDDSAPAGAGGLLAMAKAASEANVEESADGDVVVPDTMAPKSKKKKKSDGEATAS